MHEPREDLPKIEVADWALRNDQAELLDVARRLLIAREEYAIEVGQNPLGASVLLRSLQAKMWEVRCFDTTTAPWRLV